MTFVIGKFFTHLWNPPYTSR